MLNIYQLLNNVFLSTIIPGFLIALWLTGLITIGTLKVCLIASFILFVVFLFIFKFSPKLQRGILFLTFIAHPSASVLKTPHSVGICATRNFYVTHRDAVEEKNVTLGVWHTLPNYIAKKFAKELQLSEADVKSISNSSHRENQQTSIDAIAHQIKADFPEINEDNERDFYERMMRASGSKIIFYLHGNSGSRAASHRVELYQVLRAMGYHVIAFDYRSYGDSATDIAPSEGGLVRDAIAVYNYITKMLQSIRFSPGTGVSGHTLATLERQNVFGPRLLVLESPFNNIRDEVREHPFSRLFRNLPWFNYTISQPMYDNNLRFESDKHIGDFKQPVMIIHAEDDLVVPFKLGYKLYHSALDVRRKSYGPVEFHRFEATSGYGHKFLCRAPELPDRLNKFFDAYQNEKY